VVAKESGVLEVEVPRKFLMQQNVVRMATAQGGQYGAVLYPRRPNDPIPKIAAGPADTATVSTGDGEQLLFLYPGQRCVTVGDLSFEGRAGICARTGKQIELHLLEGKSLVLAGGLGVRGSGPVSLSTAEEGPAELWSNGPQREIEVLLPPGRKGPLRGASDTNVVRREEGKLILKVPAGPWHGVVP